MTAFARNTSLRYPNGDFHVAVVTIRLNATCFLRAKLICENETGMLGTHGMLMVPTHRNHKRAGTQQNQDDNSRENGEDDLGIA